MSYKILTKNGIDNSNIDGARGEYFNSGMRDGIVQGVLNEGTFIASSSNVISLNTCELRIAGHRIVIDEPVYHTFSNAPSTDTRYAFVAQIVVDDNQNVDFSLFVQTANTPLIQNDLYKNITGAGTYQVEIGRFTLLNTLEIVDVAKTIDTITGAGGVDGTYIRIGEVTTTMLDAGLDAEVDIENVTNQTTGLKETNFNFSIPKTAGSVVNVDGQQVASVNFVSDPQTQITSLNNNLNTKTTVNINNQPQQTLNFTSDPQTQINSLSNNLNDKTAISINGQMQSTLSFESDPQTQIDNKANLAGGNIFSGDQIFKSDISPISTETDKFVAIKPYFSEDGNIVGFLHGTQNSQGFQNNGYGGIFNNYSDKTVECRFVDSAGVQTTYKVQYTTEIGEDFLKIDNGILICWGTINSTSAKTINFPKQFIDNNASISLSQNGSASGKISRAGIDSLTSTGFTFDEALSRSMLPVRWMAIGYWK